MWSLVESFSGTIDSTKMHVQYLVFGGRKQTFFLYINFNLLLFTSIKNKYQKTTKKSLKYLWILWEYPQEIELISYEIYV